MKMKLDDIHIGSRLRIEYGDLEGLAESIKKYGLIHPIVVDSNNNLVAGGRRYFAVVRLGESEIETRMIGDLSETELRMLELEENIRRKDLTPAENSRRLIELAELKSAELMKAKEEIDLSTESVDNYEKSKPNHRPTVINSLQKYCERDRRSACNIKRRQKARRSGQPIPGSRNASEIPSNRNRQRTE